MEWTVEYLPLYFGSKDGWKFKHPNLGKLIAFSGKITTLRWQEKVAEIVKRLQPDCFLVTGNGLATEINKGLFNWIPELDGIARSEGDEIILLICKDALLIKELGWRKAINSGGSTLRDYISTDGTLGNFQNNFKVYGRRCCI